jgi:hypothetical protein
MHYRALTLVPRESISLPVLRKVRALIADGATVIGASPSKASGLGDFEKRDAEVKEIAEALWKEQTPRHAISGKTTRDVLLDAGLKPDFEFAGGDQKTDVSYIHRQDGDTEIYFVASRSERAETLRCTFRVAGKAPELWNAVTGERRFASAYEAKDNRTSLPLDFDPCGSWFVLFRETTAKHPATNASNRASYSVVHTLNGSWAVAFDPVWGGPPSATFDKLVGWETRSEPGIKYYSGTATYRQIFDLPGSKRSTDNLFLDLGRIREIAEVRLNGQSLGIIWAPPFRVDISHAVKATGNQLEIDVVNFWPNRVIGDTSLPPERQLTQTNIRKLTSQTPLMESGLLGPVQIVERER